MYIHYANQTQIHIINQIVYRILNYTVLQKIGSKIVRWLTIVSIVMIMVIKSIYTDVEFIAVFLLLFTTGKRRFND